MVRFPKREMPIRRSSSWGILAFAGLGMLSAFAAPPTIAIAPFQGPDSSAASLQAGSRYTEYVATFLGRTDLVRLAERAHLGKVTDEIGLQLSGLVEDSAAVEAGRFAGASHVLVGTWRREAGGLVFNARVIETGTALVKGGSIRDGLDEEDVLDAACADILGFLGVRASVRPGYRRRQGIGWGGIAAGVLAGGGALWSHSSFRSADRKYTTRFDLADSEYDALSEQAEFHKNARVYLAGGSGLLIAAGAYLLAANRKQWDFQAEPTATGRWLPLWNGHAAGLAWIRAF